MNLASFMLRLSLKIEKMSNSVEDEKTNVENSNHEDTTNEAFYEGMEFTLKELRAWVTEEAVRTLEEQRVAYDADKVAYETVKSMS